MSEKVFRLKISTPQKVSVDEDCRVITMMTANGYIGILPYHAEIIGAIEPGYLTFTLGDGKKEKALINRGVYWFKNNTLTILSDFFEFTEGNDNISAIKAIAAKIDEVGKKLALSEKTSTALNSFMKTVTFRTRKEAKE